MIDSRLLALEATPTPLDRAYHPEPKLKLLVAEFAFAGPPGTEVECRNFEYCGNFALKPEIFTISGALRKAGLTDPNVVDLVIAFYGRGWAVYMDWFVKETSTATFCEECMDLRTFPPRTDVAESCPQSEEATGRILVGPYTFDDSRPSFSDSETSGPVRPPPLSDAMPPSSTEGEPVGLKATVGTISESDRNSLYHAIARQVYGDPDKQGKVKVELYDYMRSNQAMFEAQGFHAMNLFTDQDPARPWDGRNETLAAHLRYGRDVEWYEGHPPSIVPGKGMNTSASKGEPLRLHFNGKSLHFNSVMILSEHEEVACENDEGGLLGSMSSSHHCSIFPRFGVADGGKP